MPFLFNIVQDPEYKLQEDLCINNTQEFSFTAFMACLKHCEGNYHLWYQIR